MEVAGGGPAGGNVQGQSGPTGTPPGVSWSRALPPRPGGAVRRSWSRVLARSPSPRTPARPCGARSVSWGSLSPSPSPNPNTTPTRSRGVRGKSCSSSTPRPSTGSGSRKEASTSSAPGARVGPWSSRRKVSRVWNSDRGRSGWGAVRGACRL